ncbi:hypothetical protein KCU81_g5500, partial [Aureobasidium melanogenum]|uniref:Uncharacterized protein n=1 Tax=Aureobasidium melanogenum (strain CBS 110374) TaxID=1043003 RepID=A0A074VYH9_AURM1
MSKRTESDTPTETNFADEISKKPRLDLHEQIQRAGILATQLREAANKDHLDAKAWTANQIATDELVRIFENMQEKTADTSQSVDGLIAAQVKLEVKIKMDILQQKTGNRDRLGTETNTYLLPWTPASRESMAMAAREKMEGATSGDLAAQVTEAVESTIVEKFQKGIDKQLRGLMK